MTDPHKQGETAPAASGDGGDQSMEEILASIRRILNEDEHPAGAQPPQPTPPPEDDVLLLDESMMVSAPAPRADNPGGTGPVLQQEPADMDASNPPIPAPPIYQAPMQRRDGPPGDVQPGDAPSTDFGFSNPPELTNDLIAPEAAAAAASSVGSLVRTLAAGRTTQVYSGGPTLEDMVRAELRPLLKEWLDSYLPPLVERRPDHFVACWHAGALS